MGVGWGQMWARELSEDMNHPAPFMGLFVCLFVSNFGPTWSGR